MRKRVKSQNLELRPYLRYRGVSMLAVRFICCLITSRAPVEHTILFPHVHGMANSGFNSQSPGRSFPSGETSTLDRFDKGLSGFIATASGHLSEIRMGGYSLSRGKSKAVFFLLE
jgi:hypothetical protein